MSQDKNVFRLLRMVFFLSKSYPKTKKEYMEFLDIRDSPYYNYDSEIKPIGFNLIQKDGKYWVSQRKIIFILRPQ